MKLTHCPSRRRRLRHSVTTLPHSPAPCSAALHLQSGRVGQSPVQLQQHLHPRGVRITRAEVSSLPCPLCRLLNLSSPSGQKCAIQKVVSGPASPGSLLEMQNPRPSPGLLNQDLLFKNLKKNFLTTLHSMLDLSSLTRDHTCTLCIGSMESYEWNQQGSPRIFI